jgi:hypothetical protein
LKEPENFDLQLTAEKGVLRDIKGVHKARAVMEAAAPCSFSIARAAEGNSFSIDVDASRIRRLYAGHGFD